METILQPQLYSKDITYSNISDLKAAPRDAEPPPREHSTKALFLGDQSVVLEQSTRLTLVRPSRITWCGTAAP